MTSLSLLPETPGDTVRDSRIMSPTITGGADMGKGDEGIGAEEVKAARSASGLTQAEAALVLYTSIDNWQNWEQGRHLMSVAMYELFLLKTGQFTVREIVPAPQFTVLRLRLRTGRIIEMSVKHAVVKDIAEAVDDA
jgi:putative transcriptional regulator